VGRGSETRLVVQALIVALDMAPMPTREQITIGIARSRTAAWVWS